MQQTPKIRCAIMASHLHQCATSWCRSTKKLWCDQICSQLDLQPAGLIETFIYLHENRLFSPFEGESGDRGARVKELFDYSADSMYRCENDYVGIMLDSMQW